MRRLLVAVGLMGLLSPAFAADYQLPILGGPVPTLPVSSTPTYVVGPPPISCFHLDRLLCRRPCRWCLRGQSIQRAIF